MISITNLREGAVLNHHHGIETEDSLTITVEGEGDAPIAYTLPAFCFDGESSPEIRAGEGSIEIRYDGWFCRYTTDGTVRDTGAIARNRNGYYRVFHAEGKGSVCVKVEILQDK